MKVYNPAPTPVVVDGAVIPARTETDVRSSDRVKELVDRGQLIGTKPAGKTTSKEA